MPIDKDIEKAARIAAGGHIKTCLVYDYAHGGKHTTNEYNYPNDCAMCTIIELLGQYAKQHTEIMPIIDAIKYVAR